MRDMKEDADAMKTSRGVEDGVQRGQGLNKFEEDDVWMLYRQEEIEWYGIGQGRL